MFLNVTLNVRCMKSRIRKIGDINELFWKFPVHDSHKLSWTIKRLRARQMRHISFYVACLKVILMVTISIRQRKSFVFYHLNWHPTCIIHVKYSKPFSVMSFLCGFRFVFPPDNKHFPKRLLSKQFSFSFFICGAPCHNITIQ